VIVVTSKFFRFLTFALLLFSAIELVRIELANADLKDLFPPLPAGDLELLNELAQVQMEKKPEGTSLSWKSDQTGNSGTVTLLKKGTIEGQECRRTEHQIQMHNEANARKYVLTLCLQQDGSWKWR